MLPTADKSFDLVDLMVAASEVWRLTQAPQGDSLKQQEDWLYVRKLPARENMYNAETKAWLEEEGLRTVMEHVEALLKYEVSDCACYRAKTHVSYFGTDRASMRMKHFPLPKCHL